jgi:hypothetical protein
MGGIKRKYKEDDDKDVRKVRNDKDKGKPKGKARGRARVSSSRAAWR